MNNFHRPHGGLQEADASDEAARSPFSDLAGRFANWMTGTDRLPLDETETDTEHETDYDFAPVARRTVPDPIAEMTSSDGDDDSGRDDSGRFPMAPFGYNRTAVDEHLARLEAELDQLRAKHAPMASITEELERIGEQTASILVVAHDQAHETTRIAQEQAERCVADAAANAVQITSDAKDKLRELDAETDAIWRERERLLEDVRVVSAALSNLATQASERFPAAEPAHSTGSFPAVAAPARGIWEDAAEADADADRDETAQARLSDDAGPADPQATMPFNVLEELDDDEREPGTQPGDTGSWLVGLEPPDLQD
jgi:cell division septum initiation protein DivIVA